MSNVFGLARHLVKSIVNNLDRINAPTLVLWGQQDEIVPPDHSHIVLRGIPQARLPLFQECGHLPMIERPTEFNAVVGEFLGYPPPSQKH
jgi:4,5:9,10-diseco-3-hydroxy-5,9,17-trioxoandrosta-1(10),2-diene-4-oate hydrolase